MHPVGQELTNNNERLERTNYTIVVFDIYLSLSRLKHGERFGFGTRVVLALNDVYVERSYWLLLGLIKGVV